MNIVTSRQLRPEVFRPTADALICEAFHARSRMARATALYSAAADITFQLAREDKLIQSLQRRAADIEEGACLRMFGSRTFGAFTDEEKDLALSIFQCAARAELLRLASTRQRSIFKLRARQRRIHSVLKTMNTRRFA